MPRSPCPTRCEQHRDCRVGLSPAVRAPDTIQTPRLVLRRPRPEDAEAIFARYASDREVTRYVGWPVHTSVEDTRTFLTFAAAEWEHWPAGPYLVHARAGG